jgi:cysteinyl-tRNA synthetase
VRLQLHNTLTRRKEPFEPLDPGHVRMYVCGPTVYQRIHIGNARPLIVFDVLYRLLKHLYPKVTYVRNITDIDDKIIDQARKNGEPIEALTARTTAAFFEDARALGCLEPDVQPKATEHIPEMIRLIERLIERGHAYEAEGHVLFSVPSMPAYGRLSGRNREDQIAGARVEVAPYKRDPADFVLWKPSTADQPAWGSPWGRGRPGWHLECSAMAERWLGVPFDIHGGGLDLIFPHHENEIAQTCCAHGLADMARFWLHNGFVETSGEKMAKSVGNVLRLEDALKIVPGEAIRFWMLGTHYRQPIDCTEEALREAKRTLDRFHLALRKVELWPEDEDEGEPDEVVLAALADDLNTPQALTELHGLLDRVNTTFFQRKDEARARALAMEMRTTSRLLGLLQEHPETWLHAGVDVVRVEHLVAQRVAARKQRNFAEADRIRDELLAQGILLEDGPSGTTWRRAS